MRNIWLKGEKKYKKDLVIWAVLDKHDGMLRNRRRRVLYAELQNRISPLFYQNQLRLFGMCFRATRSSLGRELSCSSQYHRLRQKQPLHLQSSSIKSRPAANRPWQILSFWIPFGTAVVLSKKENEMGRGGGRRSVICRVPARPGWQQHKCLSQETSVLLSHSAVGQSIWLQCCANSINSYLPFRSYYTERKMTEKYNGRIPKWGIETGSVESPLSLLGHYN